MVKTASVVVSVLPLLSGRVDTPVPSPGEGMTGPARRDTLIVYSVFGSVSPVFSSSEGSIPRVVCVRIVGGEGGVAVGYAF